MIRKQIAFPVAAALLVGVVLLPLNAVAQGQETAPGQQPPTNVSGPSISGTAQDGQPLTASTGDWSGVSQITYSYQWERCDTSGGGCSSIDGAVGSSYGLGSGDVGYTLRVTVTASNKNGASSVSSDPTAVVGPVPAPAPAPAPEPTTATPTPTTTTTTTTTSTTQTAPAPTSTTTTPASFDFDPSRGSLVPWDWFGIGADTFDPTSTYPTGLVNSPNTVTLTGDPLRSGAKAVQETTVVGGQSQSTPSLNSTALYTTTRPYFGLPGTDNWVHFEVMIPSSAWSSGGITNSWGFNPILFETHPQLSTAAEIDFSITTAPVPTPANPAGTTAPQLSARILGGTVGSSSNYNQSWYYPGLVQFDHWYDVLMYVHWASDNTGIFRLWVDGSEITQRVSYPNGSSGGAFDAHQILSTPNQQTLWVDGATVDHPNFELNNYHQTITSNSTVYYGRMKIGPTADSVSF